MGFLYGISVRLYGAVIFLAQLFSSKAKSWIDGRKNFWTRLPDVADKNVYWFHCASLGEFDQGLPLMNQLKKDDPSIFLVVTFFSPSGYENHHKRNHLADFVCYLPLDTKSNANRFIAHFKPTHTFFIKYEFWTNYILAARRANSTLYSVSAIFRNDHRFFKWYGAFFRNTLKQFDYFFVQNTSSLDLLHAIGIENALVSGDTRFDRVIENKKHVQPDATIEAFLNGERALVVGSSWSEEEEIIADSLAWLSGRLKVIVAPHNINENHLREIEKRFGSTIMRYSKFDPSFSGNVLLIDSIGRLANAYRFGNIAFVGGGFSGSLHNILEPAVFGLPVLFGPKHKRFPEAQTFIDAGVGFEITDASTFQKAIQFIFENESVLQSNTANLVLESTGATQRIMDFIQQKRLAESNQPT